MVKPASVSWPELLKRTWKEATQDDVLGRSAQLSYYFFLALFPLLICVIAFLGVFNSIGDHIRQQLLQFLGTVAPGSAFELVQRTLDEVSRSHSGSKMSLALVFSLWTASAGMSAIMDTLNAQYEVEESRSLIRRNAVAIALTIATAVLLMGAVAIIVAGGPTATAFSRGIMSLIFKLAQWPIAVALVLLGFALIYFFAPDVKEQKWQWVTPGAVAGLLLWLAVSFALKIYLHFFDHYSATYGSLGAVIILLLWFYLTGAAVLMGAELNTVIEDAAAQEGRPDAKLKGEKATGQSEARPA